MNRKISIGVTISIAAVVCALTFIITWFVSLQSFNEKVQAVKEKAEKYERLENLDSFVRANYYETELDEEGVMNGMLKGYVAGLGDPYSKYMTAEEYEAYNLKESGQSVGIGVTVERNEDGLPRIIEVSEGSPAEEAGIQTGDVIVAVDGELVKDLGYDTAIDNVRGESGTRVEVTVERGSVEVSFEIRRRAFNLKTVTYEMLDDQIGYIRVKNFRENTVDQFDEALDFVTASGAEGIIFDMRGNGGGLLESLEKMLDPLLPEGVIATASYQDGTSETIVYSDASEMDLPMIVLVDDGTASAAELFSAALRDFGKAELVGTTTYGKGVAQFVGSGGQGNYFKLSVYYFLSPKGSDIDGVGIVPDVAAYAQGERTAEEIAQIRASVAPINEAKKYYAGDSGLNVYGVQQRLAKMGYDVTIYEALHKAGGVLTYGIPEFRLPKDMVVAEEVKNVEGLGVKIITDVIIGRTITLDELVEEEGFEAVFIGSGAGLPMFMGIPGENANGVFSANEYLTRNNLMKAFRDDYDTPIYKAKKCVVVGGGNVAMDAARTALRLGAEVHLVYRRSEAELPARAEEVHHAKEEGVIFDLLTNPTKVLTDENDNVTGIECIRMELGEPDASGRRRPVPVAGSEFQMECDAVIMSLGTSPNPLISSTTPGLEVNRRKCLVATEDEGKTTKEGVYAGGDAVTGAATVILAMGAGRAGAKGIDNYIKSKNA